MNNTRVNKMKSTMCKIFGHSWRYKDYTNFMKPNGDQYEFKASRNCLRCGQHAYYYSSWENEEKSKLDFESDSHSTKKININTKF